MAAEVMSTRPIVYEVPSRGVVEVIQPGEEVKEEST